MDKIAKTLLVWVFIFSALITSSVSADNIQTTVIQSNQTETIWSGWNVRGKLYFKIRSDIKGDSCITAWWNRLGKNTKHFQLCDGGSLDYRIPAYIFARLKVGWPKGKTVIAVSGNAAVVSSYQLCGRHIDC